MNVIKQGKLYYLSSASLKSQLIPCTDGINSFGIPVSRDQTIPGLQMSLGLSSMTSIPYPTPNYPYSAQTPTFVPTHTQSVLYPSISTTTLYPSFSSTICSAYPQLSVPHEIVLQEAQHESDHLPEDHEDSGNETGTSSSGSDTSITGSHASGDSNLTSAPPLVYELFQYSLPVSLNPTTPLLSKSFLPFDMKSHLLASQSIGTIPIVLSSPISLTHPIDSNLANQGRILKRSRDEYETTSIPLSTEVRYGISPQPTQLSSTHLM